MSDRDLRELERSAARGDLDALERLTRARERAGLDEPDLRLWLTVKLHRANTVTHLARIGSLDSLPRIDAPGSGVLGIRSICGGVCVGTYRPNGQTERVCYLASMRGPLVLTWTTAASKDEGAGLCQRCYAGHLKRCRGPQVPDEGWRADWHLLLERAAAIGFPSPQDD